MRCVEVYRELYQKEPFGVAFCPYRISPLGAHIDHQYGKINGLAIDKGLGVFNGDVGIIQEINDYSSTVSVLYDENRLVQYPFKGLDELELAYAITIHKSQGSEYPAVVMPLLPGPRMLMNRNLLYTAVTRARKCITIVGDENVFYQMVDNTTQQRRYSGLQERIKEALLS